ncbi:MAG TPA: phosphatidic acid phosphatase [Spirochaetaceae bacterium]|nr:phosphatidic acid phosphatase [Spirochaetaceae bacterium]
MEGVSLFAVTYLILIPVFVYWVIGKRRGLFTLASYFLCAGLNALVKLTACVYRPWIRDPRIIPAGDSIETATGYSFPSGHTITAGTIYGGTALSLWKPARLFSILCLILVFLTGFSRNYLGVHTPQDVIVGVLEAALVLFVVEKLFMHVEKKIESEIIVLSIFFAIGWLGMAYVTYKSYPMDYIDGKLLVDPMKMKADGYTNLGYLIAFPVARLFEKSFVKFKPAGPNLKGIVMGGIGTVSLYLMIKYLKPLVHSSVGYYLGRFAFSFILVFYCVALYPMIIKLVMRGFRK